MSKHSTNIIIHKTLRIQPGVKGLHLIPYEIETIGRHNHSFSVHFQVQQPTSNKYDIQFYLLTEEQLIDWLVNCREKKNRFLPITKFEYYSKRAKNGKITFESLSSGKTYFVLDNSYSFTNTKTVKIKITEEWDEIDSIPNVFTTTSVTDKSLFNEFGRLISNSRKSLKITSPFIDTTMIDKIIESHRKGGVVKFITKPKDEIQGKDCKNAFENLKETLGENLKTHSNIHSRMIIRDNLEACVSSADLSRDSFGTLFNLGITISDKQIIKKIDKYFEKIWKKSSS